MNSDWTFLSNHAHVLLALSVDPNLRLRELADRVGITERAVARIVSDLVSGGYLRVVKEGRRNVYTLDTALPLRHPVEAHATIQDLVRLMDGAPRGPR